MRADFNPNPPTSQFQALHQKYGGPKLEQESSDQDTRGIIEEDTLTRGGGKTDKTAMFPGRDGYDPDFLGVHLPMPEVDQSYKSHVAPLLADPTQSELKYTHFSVVMDKDRRCPLVTAVNIDGATIQALPRKGTWVLDGRMDQKYQMGNEAYANNDIDKGHMVRRRDPQWGKDADKAGGDTFVYTNSGLQHANLNQRPWLNLEDYVIGGAIANKEKKCVFTGPVLRDDDPSFSNDGMMSMPTKMPMAFYKVEVWNEPGKGLQGEAFLMSQKDIVDKPKGSAPWKNLTPMQLQEYRIPMAQLEEITHLHFGAIQDIPDPTGTRGGMLIAEGGE